MYDYKNYKGFMDESVDRSILIDEQGRQRTQSLFVETLDRKTAKKYRPIFCLSDKEVDEYPSAYQIYMSSVDEYEAAMKLVGSIKHWRRLLQCNWFLNGNSKLGYEGLEQWRQDMAERDAMTAKSAVLSSARKGDTGAARLLLDLSKAITKKNPGRPATKKDKEEKEAENEEAARLAAIEKQHKALNKDG